MQIREGGLDHPAVAALLRLHLDSMAGLSPPESVHALDPAGLRAPGSASSPPGTAPNCSAAGP